MPRLFVGIAVPDEIKKAVAGLQESLSRLKMDCKFVEKENMHLCLSFLGDVEDDKVGQIEAALDDIGKEHGKFSVSIGRMKFVPNLNRLRVIVLEATDASGSLERLRSNVVKVVGGDSKPPHLTLCRVKDIEDKEVLEKRFGDFILGKSFGVDCIELIRSDLSRSGPTYTKVHRTALS